jgi:hypothetical protein
MSNQLFFYLSESVYIESALSVGTAHLNVGKLELIVEFLPSTTDQRLTSLPIEVRILFLYNRHHLSSEETICGHVPELTRRFDRRVRSSELDIMNLLLDQTFKLVSLMYCLYIVLVELVFLPLVGFLFLG